MRANDRLWPFASDGVLRHQTCNSPRDWSLRLDLELVRQIPELVGVPKYRSREGIRTVAGGLETARDQLFPSLLAMDVACNLGVDSRHSPPGGYGAPKWLLVGFIHGVMNTDNMSIAGETIDYGPCAFMDSYHPQTVYSSIDQMGRYAYGNQPAIAQWNLLRLAETLLPLLTKDQDAAIMEAKEAISTFAKLFETAYTAGLSRKLGLLESQPDDSSLAKDLLDRMANNGADFTLVFRGLCDAAGPDGDAGVRSLFSDPRAFDNWSERWRHRLAQEGREPTERRSAMRAVDPAFIPRNHLVEEAIIAAETDGDFSAFEKLLSVISAPYEDQPRFGRYAEPPRLDQVVHRTFCGT
jgi:uncharacterized protein YdiU (UPF0061 family)